MILILAFGLIWLTLAAVAIIGEPNRERKPHG
jgi:hypothetical protein